MADENENVSPHYLSVSSDDTDITKCSYVKAYCTPNNIEAVGVSYKSPIRTIKEMEEEKECIKRRFPDLQAEVKKGLTAEARLAQLDIEIAERRKMLKISRKGKVRKKSKTKIDNLDSIRRSQKNLVRLVRENFSVPFVLCATLTYEMKEYDINNVYKDFRKCRRKLRYYFPNISYIAIYEYHADGSLHIHLIYKNAKGLKREMLENIWQKGFVFIEEFNALAAPYFCSKDDRLHFYPSGAKLYTSSRNLRKPTQRNFSVEGFQEFVENSGMKCVSTNARTLFRVNEFGKERVNHFVYKNYQKWFANSWICQGKLAYYECFYGLDCI